uniref:Uncharacterized protein n=1 Tax=Rhizophora mucronata TaxID=61149 RepID=A0A2P2JR69_RHIMU
MVLKPLLIVANSKFIGLDNKIQLGNSELFEHHATKITFYRLPDVGIGLKRRPLLQWDEMKPISYKRIDLCKREHLKH